MAKKKAKPNEVAATEGINSRGRGGKPSTFKPEYCDRVQALCKLGTTDRDLCLFFDVSYQTIENWKKRYPEFFVKMLQGKQEADKDVAEALFKNANGYDYYEEVPNKLKRVEYGPDGKVTSTEEYIETTRVLRHQPADTTAQIYWLKNRKPAEWRDAKQIELGPETLKATQQGATVLSELQSRGFVELDGEYTIVVPKEDEVVE